MVDNKEYIETLVVCGKIDMNNLRENFSFLDRQLNQLYDSRLNLQLLMNYFFEQSEISLITYFRLLFKLEYCLRYNNNTKDEILNTERRFIKLLKVYDEFSDTMFQKKLCSELDDNLARYTMGCETLDNYLTVKRIMRAKQNTLIHLNKVYYCIRKTGIMGGVFCYDMEDTKETYLSVLKDNNIVHYSIDNKTSTLKRNKELKDLIKYDINNIDNKGVWHPYFDMCIIYDSGKDDEWFTELENGLELK